LAGALEESESVLDLLRELVASEGGAGHGVRPGREPRPETRKQRRELGLDLEEGVHGSPFFRWTVGASPWSRGGGLRGPPREHRSALDGVMAAHGVSEYGIPVFPVALAVRPEVLEVGRVARSVRRTRRKGRDETLEDR